MIAAALLALVGAAPQEVSVIAVKVDTAPTLDGDGSETVWDNADWADIPTSRTDLPSQGKIPLKLKAVYTADSIFFLATWPDDTKDDVHQPYEWSETVKKYVESNEKLEDQFSLAFPMSGDFTADMFTQPLVRSNMPCWKWDVWQWGAARTPHGFARDRIHEYYPKKPTKAAPKGGSLKEHNSRESKPIWILRADDAGTPPCKENAARPVKKTQDVVLRFEPQKPTGSSADVAARGAWKDNQWTLEMGRKLDTKAADDVKFAPKKEMLFAVGIFDHDREDVHRTSKVLRLTWK
jgi:hypothetical protein